MDGAGRLLLYRHFLGPCIWTASRLNPSTVAAGMTAISLLLTFVRECVWLVAAPAHGSSGLAMMLRCGAHVPTSRAHAQVHVCRLALPQVVTLIIVFATLIFQCEEGRWQVDPEHSNRSSPLGRFLRDDGTPSPFPSILHSFYWVLVRAAITISPRSRSRCGAAPVVRTGDGGGGGRDGGGA